MLLGSRISHRLTRTDADPPEAVSGGPGELGEVLHWAGQANQKMQTACRLAREKNPGVLVVLR